jgi:hypothetical protein
MLTRSLRPLPSRTTIWLVARSTSFTRDGERGEKRADLRGSHLGRVPLAVKEDVPPDPVHVGLLGPAAVVARSCRQTNLIQELGLRRVGELTTTDRPPPSAAARRRPAVRKKSFRRRVLHRDALATSNRNNPSSKTHKQNHAIELRKYHGRPRGRQEVSKWHQAASSFRLTSIPFCYCPRVDLLEQVRGIEAPEALLGDHGRLPD